MNLTIHVEGFDHPNDPAVSIQFTDEQLHQCIELSEEEAERLLTELRGVIKQ